jgi:hypothetical protein
MPWLNGDPIRGFSWRRDLDFAAGVIGVVSRPMRLRFDAANGCG